MQAMISGLQPKDIVATVRRQSLESQEKVLIICVRQLQTITPLHFAGLNNTSRTLPDIMDDCLCRAKCKNKKCTN